MGEEWGASAPFPYFCDYHGDLAESVRKGRCEQLSKLDPAPSEDEMRRAPDPQAESTLRSAQLNWNEIAEPAHLAWLDLYKGLLRTRMEQIVPLLGGLVKTCGGSEIIGPGCLTVHWSLREGAILHLEANLCKEARSGFAPVRGRVIWQEGTKEAEDRLGPWSVRWSVEQPTS
jgi:1,4-alpha-glucan branching enzyme